MSGDHRTDDLDRLFLGQRTRSWNCACFREIGDFVAHRDTREKGLITQVGRDVFTSVDVYTLKMRGLEISRNDIARTARANLRLATDEQLKDGCGCRRETAQKRLERALEKYPRGQELTDTEYQTLDYLATKFIWRPAFKSSQLFAEFKHVLVRNGIVEKMDSNALDNAKTFLTLYALALMHGSSIVLEHDQKAKLFAGFANQNRLLEVKVEIVFRELRKPLMAPICLFLTDLHPEEHCEPNLMMQSEPVLVDHWQWPIEVGAAGRLTRIG